MIQRRAEIFREVYRGPMLYDLKEDPQQKRNIFRKQVSVARRLHAEYVRQLEQLGTDESYVEPRRTLL